MNSKMRYPSGGGDPYYVPGKDLDKMGNSEWRLPSVSVEFSGTSDATLFSSSLPVLPHEKLNFRDSGINFADDISWKFRETNTEGEDSGEDTGNNHGIRSLLPGDESELFEGLMDDFDLSELPTQMEDLEEYDIFGTGGGMEMDYDPQEKLSVAMAKLSTNDSFGVNGTGHYSLTNGAGTIAGEHPYGEHPSRTLFVRNINSNVDDSELRELFEQHGPIRTLYTTCKHRGFVMISYYDIRDARNAMRALQNRPLRRRKLDIHFSIPKENPSDKDINQGTLVVFNLDPSVSNDHLLKIFGVYGEVKEIRETPHKRHHKFIEFYDVRAAEAALRSLNRSDIAGKRIKLEPSRPGGARRNLINQLSQELDQDETRSFLHNAGSPVASPPGIIGHWAQLSSPTESTPLHGFSRSPSLTPISPMTNNQMSGLASILSPMVSNSTVAPLGKDQAHSDQVVSSTRGNLFQQSHSFPGPSSSMKLSMSPSSGAGSSFGLSDSSAPGINTLTGSQFLWGSPTPYSEPGNNTNWKPSMRPSFASGGQRQGQSFSYSGGRGSLPHHLNVGSAPAPFAVPFERQYGFHPGSPDTSFVSTATHGFGSPSLNRVEGSFMGNIGSRSTTNNGIGIPFSGAMSETSSPNFRLMSSPRPNHAFLGGAGPYLGMLPGSIDGFSERYRSRRVESHGGQIDSKKLFQLDIEKIASGEDTRTTLMIKNIPNKYSSKMLLAAIDENHRGTFDFVYLPIDFKNKCNVGYAFINMISPSHIIPFYQAFNGKKWEKFNSEKVASLAYARIQGKTALITHFQNSSLMNEDKRCRPILFNYDEVGTDDQITTESFLSNDLNGGILNHESLLSSDDFPEISVKDI